MNPAHPNNAPDLTIVVPIYNEEANLDRAIPVMLDTIDELDLPCEIILVNDGSLDRSKEIIDEICAKYDCVSSVNHEINEGFGAAIKSGFKCASGQYIMYYPADSILRVAEVQNYLALIKNCDVVVGYRRGRPDYTLYRKVNSILYYMLVNLLFGLRLNDVNWVHMY